MFEAESAAALTGGALEPANLVASEIGRAAADIARVHERLVPEGPRSVLTAGSLRVDLQARTVSVGGEQIALTGKEFDLLAYLAARPGVAVGRAELLRDVWQSESGWQDPATVTEHVYRLRSKIERSPAEPRTIVTVRGSGYRFDPGAGIAAETRSRLKGGRMDYPSQTSASVTASEQMSAEIPDAVIVTDAALRILSWNSAATEMYGWTESEVLGESMSSVVPANEPYDFNVAVDASEVNGWERQVRQMTRDGSEITVMISVSVLRDHDGAVSAIVAVTRMLGRDVVPQPPPAVGNIAAKEVRRGLARREFVVYYEPIVLLADREIVGARTLTRWLRPDGASWESDSFLDAVERAGALDELATFVLAQAVLQVERWRDAGRTMAVAIELRVGQLTHVGLMQNLAAATAAMTDAGGQLWVEVEQRDIGGITSEGLSALASLVDAGAHISIRGFGVGGTNIAAQDGTIPVQALKIDASLINGLDQDVSISEFVNSIFALGKTMGVPVAAEGVATVTQHAALRATGCLVGQGPLYGAPVLGDYLIANAVH